MSAAVDNSAAEGAKDGQERSRLAALAAGTMRVSFAALSPPQVQAFVSKSIHWCQEWRSRPLADGTQLSFHQGFMHRSDQSLIVSQIYSTGKSPPAETLMHLQGAAALRPQSAYHILPFAAGSCAGRCTPAGCTADGEAGGAAAAGAPADAATAAAATPCCTNDRALRRGGWLYDANSFCGGVGRRRRSRNAGASRSTRCICTFVRRNWLAHGTLPARLIRLLDILGMHCKHQQSSHVTDPIASDLATAHAADPDAPARAEALIWHANETGIKPIVGNPRIERHQQPKFDERLLHFPAWVRHAVPCLLLGP